MVGVRGGGDGRRAVGWEDGGVLSGDVRAWVGDEGAWGRGLGQSGEGAGWCRCGVLGERPFAPKEGGEGCRLVGSGWRREGGLGCSDGKWVGNLRWERKGAALLQVAGAAGRCGVRGA
ncbi:hypothetical protein Tco_0849591 [Tanacetum coccineum]